MKTPILTSYVYIKKSFLNGYARLLDIGATMGITKRDTSASEEDSDALRSDWETVGADLWTAINAVKKDYLWQKSNLTIDNNLKRE